MKVLLLYPNVNRSRAPQLGLAMISAVAKELGHQVELFDLTTVPSGQETSAFQSRLSDFRPDILGVSLRSNELPFIKELLSSVSLENTITVFGGPHATVSPEEVIPMADVVVIGEGEATFAELLKRIENNEDITDVLGCWVRKNGEIFKNEMRELIADLDTLPFPDWEIFDTIHFSNNYAMTYFKGAKIIGVFEGSRGCPYACTYCTNAYMRTLFRGKGVWRREKSPERLIEEMRLFRERYGLEGVVFVDEILLSNIDKTRRFRDLFLSEIGVPFAFMERPENMTEERVRLISEAGAIMVSIGIESGDQELRKKVLNRHYTQEQVISAFHTAKKHGLRTHAFTMIGLPEQDVESINKTHKLLREAQPDTVQTSVFYPLRRTRLFDKMVQRGELDPDNTMPRSYHETDDIELKRYQFLLLYYYLPKSLVSVFLFAQSRRFTRRLFSLFLGLVKLYRNRGLLSTIEYVVKRRTPSIQTR